MKTSQRKRQKKHQEQRKANRQQRKSSYTKQLAAYYVNQAYMLEKGIQIDCQTGQLVPICTTS